MIHGWRSLLVLVLVLLLTGSPLAVAARKAPPQPGQGSARLSGQLRDAAGKGLEGARVTLASVEPGAPPQTVLTGRGGSFSFSGLKSGYYTLNFEVDGAVFPSNRILMISPKRAHRADFRLGPTGPQDQLPGGSGPAPVMARLVERTGPTGLQWFTTGKGVAVLVGGVALSVAGLIAATSGEEERQASSSNP